MACPPRVQPGQRVLVNGASGGVGTFAVQIARALGANVTAICSPSNVDTLRGLGADRVIDYTQEEFTQGPERYDLMVDDIAGSRSWPECVRVLEPKATLVAVGTSSAHSLGGILGHAALLRLRSIGASQRLVIFLARIRQPDLLVLQQLLQSGKVTPVIDRRYPFSQAAEALPTSRRGTRAARSCSTCDHPLEWRLGIGADVRRTPAWSLRANSIAERSVASARREALDWLLVLNECHLRGILKDETGPARLN